ncbi:MAG: TonB-dependent receptor plug domain-containing protein [Gemmatimonadetes bacterium]|nr:TonB-dependent receptor plug domain-containing protein [Gemmatimonadota bacterium]
MSLRARDVALRDALDRLSAAAGAPLSYTSELLPLDRRVCLTAAGLPLGDALTALVSGSGAEPVVVARQVVLAPARTGAAPAAQEPERESVLERIVVTGSPAGSARRPLAVGLSVLDGRELSARSATSMAEVMNATVPGVWLWRRSPTELLAQYGSVRGASSFAATAPKVYIDGVEVANPLVLTEIDPELVERVEVIRGPQGAALYGADAISGVVNIVTRHDVGGGRHAEFRTDAGAAASDYAARPVGTHRERLAFRAGNNLQSMAAAVTVGGSGALYPDAGNRTVSALATGRWVAPHAIFTGTFRFYDATAGAGRNPILGGILPDTTVNAPAVPAATSGGRGRRGARGEHGPDAAMYPVSLDSAAATAYPSQGVREYTAGAAAMLAPGRWTVSLLAGLDGYRLDHVAESTGPFPSSIDPVLRSGTGGGDRGTFRASGVTRLVDDGRGTVDLTLGLEHSVMRESTSVAMVRRADGDEPYGSATTRAMVSWLHDTGVLAQASGSWRNTWFATAGMRVERNDALGGFDELSTLPMLGLAWVHPVGRADVKLRAAYGRGIRPPRVPSRDGLRVDDDHGLGGYGYALSPESQSGLEVGAELYLAQRFSLQVTRFDQRATGLIQDVVVAFDTVSRGGHVASHVRYAPQNVGSITNRGWEMQGTLRQGDLSLSGSLALVDSRVRTVAPGYGGDLRPGDRMLAVPARTAGLTADWTAGGWTGALTASRAWDWINYDRLALASTFARPAAQAPWFRGDTLRAFWRRYDGDTNVRATLSRQVTPSVAFILTGDNLLGGQLGEPDNVTIRAGRTLTLGIRTSF